MLNHQLVIRSIALVVTLSSWFLPAAQAAEEVTWQLQLSPYTYHFHPSPEHRPVRLIGLERHQGTCQLPYLPAGKALWGGSYFSNSFGQPSAFGYIGCHFDNVLGNERVFVKASAGVLYGYKPPFEHKVPLNYKGWSPGLVLGLGYKFTPQLSGQVNILGNSALMFAVNYSLGQ
jgi:hypothetical protein